MSIEKHPCPSCGGMARVEQMFYNSTTYHCGCGMKFTITHENPVPLGTDNHNMELLNSITRY